MGETQRITGASAILHALQAAGVTHLFVNLGSDHPAFVAAFAAKQPGSLHIITSPNEMKALSAASGFAQVTGRPAAVLVHVECGTQGLGAAVHNISKGRIPALILAGTPPVTMEGEEAGSRNEYIHWIQDVPDQRAIVRQYMKYEHEIRSPHNAAQITLRALQFATTSPQGPTYLIASRETLERKTIHPEANGVGKPSQTAAKNLAVEPIGLSPSAIQEIASALANAKKPLIVTSYSGRSAEAFAALRALAEALVIPVHENAPTWNNFPTTSFLHQGHQWNGGGQLPALAEADVVLVVDSDVPWIPVQSKPSDEARVFHLDSDPLKTSMTLWGLPCEKRWQCESSLALAQLASCVKGKDLASQAGVKARIDSRRTLLQQRFEQRQSLLRSREAVPADGSVTAPYFVARFRDMTRGLTITALNESTTNLPNVADHLHHTHPHALIGSGGGGLGWYSGAAVGASLGLQTLPAPARPPLLVAFTGDGTFLFGVPSSAYWMARRYATPYLTVVWNNGGWAAPRAAAIRVHGHLAGREGLTGDAGVGLQPSPDSGRIAEGAGGAWTARVGRADEVDAVVRQAVDVVREGRCAVVEVVLKSI
ncbi:hypothetical protein S40288_04202 [Stachybotrys chartarum IBT 40288]|nr:hypothetical protein S40288_04202 [Stachybotrys chartarum IBT 40288]